MLRRMSAPINLLFACVYAAIGVAVATAQDRPERAFVLDPSAVSVTAVDISNGSILSTAPLSASPQQMLLTRDNSQLLIFDQGPGKETIRFGYHPTGKSMMTSFDPKTMKKLWQIEVGWGFSQAFFSPDGNQIMILCPGYTSQKPQETLARELVAVDIRSGTVTARLAIDHPIIAIYPSPDGATAITKRHDLQETFIQHLEQH